MEELVPFSVIGEAEDMASAYKIYKHNVTKSGGKIFIIANHDCSIIYLDGRRYIYESPDNGKTIYRRSFNLLSEKELYDVK
jgi:hypothetical protein